MKTVIAGALGECVHVAGVMNFLRLAEAADALHARGVRFAFGGTPPVAERVRQLGFFERIFDGSEPGEHVLAYLKGQPTGGQTAADYPETRIERIQWKVPYPVMRHHFGLSTLEATRESIVEIATAEVLDVISLGIDQDA